MKKYAVLTILLLIFAGCGKGMDIQFCEGVSEAGEGVNCGKKFRDGTLTAVINADKPFGQKKITIKIYELSKNKETLRERKTISVDPVKKRASTNLDLYTEGQYIVRAYKGKTAISTGKIEIVE